MHFSVATLGIDLFSGVYLRVMCLWCAVFENSSFQGVHQVGQFFARKLKQSRFPKHRAFLKCQMMDKATKKNIVQSASHSVFCLFYLLTFEDQADRLSQKSTDLTLRYGDAGLGLVLRGPVQSDPVWRGLVWGFLHEFKMTLRM